MTKGLKDQIIDTELEFRKKLILMKLENAKSVEEAKAIVMNCLQRGQTGKDE